MHTVDLFEEAARMAAEMGYHVRIECLEGCEGSCVVGGRKLIFVDLAGTPADRLDALLAALAADPQSACWPASPLLARLLRGRAAA